MATTKKRINISVNDNINDSLQALAKSRKQPVATVASTLLQNMLEIEEDSILSEIADSRLNTTKKGDWVKSSDDVWK